MLLMNFLAALLLFAPSQASDQISDLRKQEFINLLRTLPTKGELYTDEAVLKAGPFLPVLFALTEKDVEKYDIYPFAAISRGLCDYPGHRVYAIRNFGKIRHPKLRLFWGAMLFDSGDASPEIDRFLRDALASEAIRDYALQAEVKASVHTFRHSCDTSVASRSAARATTPGPSRPEYHGNLHAY